MCTPRRERPLRRLGEGHTEITIEPKTVYAADLDGDGDTDFASANMGNTATGALTGVTTFLSGPSGFQKKPTQGLETGLPNSMVVDAAVGDLDMDGDPDFVLADEGGGALVVFEQDVELI